MRTTSAPHPRIDGYKKEPHKQALLIAKDFIGDGETYRLLKETVDFFLANRKEKPKEIADNGKKEV